MIVLDKYLNETRQIINSIASYELGSIVIRRQDPFTAFPYFNYFATFLERLFSNL